MVNYLVANALGFNESDQIYKICRIVFNEETAFVAHGEETIPTDQQYRRISLAVMLQLHAFHLSGKRNMVGFIETKRTVLTKTMR